MGLTLPGTTVGTLSYLAPELLHGADATPASDAWALGAVAYRALTGVLPYPSATVVDLVREHARPPMPPSLIEASLPTAVDAPLLSVLGTQGSRPSPLELGAALSAIAAGGVAAGMPADWSAATTSVLATSEASRGALAFGMAPAPARAAKRWIPLRAAFVAGCALFVGAVIVAAGMPQSSSQTLAGTIDTLPHPLAVEHAPAPTPAPVAVTRNPPAVSEAVHRRASPPRNDHGHGPRQGHGAGHGQGPKHGHGPGPRHGHGRHDHGENGD